MPMMPQDMTYKIPWNICLITLGSIVIALAVKPIAIPHGFLPGGISGVGLLLYYLTGALTPGMWYLALNVPVFALGWFYISRRFMLYTLYGMACLSFFIDFFQIQFRIEDPMLAAVTAGAIMGAGSGIVMRSLGSAGGTDIVAIFLNQRFNTSIGQFNFLFNLVLFGISLFFLNTEVILYSLAMNFVYSQVLDYFLCLFNERKLVLIVSENHREISEAILSKIHRGSTILHGHGAYTGREKNVILSVVNNLQLKRLEEEVFLIDPQAFLIIENTFNVLGRGFSRRKIY